VTDTSARPPANGEAIGNQPVLMGLLFEIFAESRSGFVYVAFVSDVYARYIVGWQVSRTARMLDLYLMRWNKPCMTGGLSITAAWSITATLAASPSQSNRLSD
jgi:hypothetical protein